MNIVFHITLLFMNKFNIFFFNFHFGSIPLIRLLKTEQYAKSQNWAHRYISCKRLGAYSDCLESLLLSRSCYLSAPLTHLLRASSFASRTSSIILSSRFSLKEHGPLYLFVLRFYGPVNPMGSCRARSVYLTTHLLGRLSPLSG